MLADFILAIPVILLSLAIHEFSHGKAADMLGDPTPRAHGRLTLNPISHLDPIGALVLLLTQRFGWAKPVPINPYNFRNPRQDILVVSLAGPLSNVVLSFIFAQAYRIMYMAIVAGHLPLPQDNMTGIVFKMLEIGIVLNLALAFFNLLPVPPLDGSKILRGIIPHQWSHYLDFFEGPYGFMVVLLLLVTGVIGAILSPFIMFFTRLFLIGL